MADSLGIYVSVPFCKAKCTFCNFASDAFPAARLDAYVDRLCADIASARAFAAQHQLRIPTVCNSIFLGGGTPSLLAPTHVERLFAALRDQFAVSADAEITVEAAPGQLPEDVLEALLRGGVNRISFGVQSFIDAETRAVGRLHTAAQCREEIGRVRRHGLANVNLDLIAGLPHQTHDSWRQSLEEAMATGVPHISVYMLEVDEDSRLGRELIGPNVRYSSQAVPDEALTTDLYLAACEALAAAGLLQYEISNFARPGWQSRHNRKYWERAPYLGFGLDAHSMLLTHNAAAARFANTGDLDGYLSDVNAETRSVEAIETLAAFEESVFLGLRLTEGVSLIALRNQHSPSLVGPLLETARDLQSSGLMRIEGDILRLTPRGRLLSSSVFGELLATPA